MPKSIYMLTLCQALLMSNTALMAAASALIGLSLAEDKALATLPISLQFLAMMLTSVPASLLMGKIGRRAGFSIAAIIGAVSGAIAMYAILNQHFVFFCIAAMGIGVFTGFGNYLRFAAAEIAGEALKTKAISYVLLGGVAAAFMGPNLANIGREIFPAEPFAGGFVFVIAFYLMVLFILCFVNFKATNVRTSNLPTRSLTEIAKQPKFIVAVICGMLSYGVMSYLMTATPLAMKHHHHDFTQTAFVIQWHIVAMFAPSFFTSVLVKKFGLINIMLIGTLLGFATVIVNISGTSVEHFWFGLVLLGVSWNFLFVGATSLLTETYRPEETSKVQAANDFIVFTMVTFASLSAGVFQHKFGWEIVNYGSLPLTLIMLLSLVWLNIALKKQSLSLPH